jgi:hypothetical protein
MFKISKCFKTLCGFLLKKSIFEPTSTIGSAVSSLEWHSHADKNYLVTKALSSNECRHPVTLLVTKLKIAIDSKLH